MIPKFTSLAFRRMSFVTSPRATPNTFDAVVVWMSSPFRNASVRPVAREVRHDAQLDLRIVGGQISDCPSSRE